MSQDSAEEYMRLPYSTEVVPDVCTDGSQCYLASNPELPGCISHGRTPEEAQINLQSARRLYIKALLKRGLHVPRPMPVYSQTEGTGQSIVWSVDVVSGLQQPVLSALLSQRQYFAVAAE
jgi:predicted RNase H-like HicB family nuclease